MTYVIASKNPAMHLRFVHYFGPFDIFLSIQEISLSSLYIYLFARFMRQGDRHVSHDVKKALYLLVIVEVIKIICHTVLYVLLILEFYLARKMILALVYAIQVKIEFIVLNSFMDFSWTGQASFQTRSFRPDSEITGTDTARISVPSTGFARRPSFGLESVSHYPDSVGVVSGNLI